MKEVDEDDEIIDNKSDDNQIENNKNKQAGNINDEIVEAENDNFYNRGEYATDFIRNYKPVQRVNTNDTPPVQFYTTSIKGLMSVSDVFPDFSKEIENLSIEMMTIEAEMGFKKKTRLYLPNDEGRDSHIFITDDPEVKNGINAFREKYNDFMNRISAAYTDPNSVQYRLINVIKKNSELLDDPAHLDKLSGFPEYYKALKCSFMDMPDSNFAAGIGENDNPVYKSDLARYQKFMSNHVFLDQIEDKQNFFINEYLPYAEKRKNGTLTSEEAVDYNSAYLNHLIKQKEYFETIMSYGKDDPDIAASKMCNNPIQFEGDWQGDRFGKMTLDKINRNIDAMGRGWPAADMNFLDELHLIQLKLADMAENSNQGFTAEEQKAAKRLQSKMKKPYNNILKKNISSPEERMELITGIEESLKDYISLDTAYKARTFKGDLNINGPHSLTWLLDEAKGRKVFRSEVGKNHQIDSELHSNLYTDLSSHHAYFNSALTDSLRERFNNAPETKAVMDRDGVEEYGPDDEIPNLADEAFEPKYKFNHRAYLHMANDYNISIVRDPEALERYKKQVNKMADTMDEFIAEDVPDDEIGRKMKEFFRYNVSEKVRRAAKGYSESYMDYKSPFLGAALSYHGLVDPTLENDHFRNYLKKWGAKFPIVDIAIEHGKLSDTYIDYFEEKKKAGGTLSPKREEFYRQKIYDHTVLLGALHGKMSAVAESKEYNAAIKRGTLLMEDIFHIHPLSPRGTKAMASGIEAYKTGLENGWSLEDLPTLTAFHMLMTDLETGAKYKSNTVLHRVVKIDPPRFDSEERKNTFLKMKDLYIEIISTPLTSEKQRNEFMRKMSDTVREGIANGGLKTAGRYPIHFASYFLQTENQTMDRTLAVVTGKEPAVYQPVKCGPDRKVESILCDLNTRRTDLWFGSENAEHKNLREAVEDMQKFMKDNPNPGVTKEEILSYSEKYLSKLDAVQRHSKIYQEKRKGASSRGGKARLSGARKVFDFAEFEKDNLLDRIKATTDLKFKDIDELRNSVAINKKLDAVTKLTEMTAMPRSKDEIKELHSLAADILVAKIVVAKSSPGYKTFKEMGNEAFKKEVLKSKEFKALITTYIRDQNMTPEKFAIELSGDGALGRLRSFTANMKRSEDLAAEKAADKEAKAGFDTMARQVKMASREQKFKQQKQAEKEAKKKAQTGKGMGKK